MWQTARYPGSLACVIARGRFSEYFPNKKKSKERLLPRRRSFEYFLFIFRSQRRPDEGVIRQEATSRQTVNSRTALIMCLLPLMMSSQDQKRRERHHLERTVLVADSEAAPSRARPRLDRRAPARAVRIWEW